MVIARIFGWLLLAGAIAVAALSFVLWLTGQDLTEVTGQVWYHLHPASLNLTQAVVQRYIHPRLWDDVLLPLLQWPAYRVLSLVFLGPFVVGAVFLVVFKKPEKKRFFTRPPAS